MVGEDRRVILAARKVVKSAAGSCGQTGSAGTGGRTGRSQWRRRTAVNPIGRRRGGAAGGHASAGSGMAAMSTGSSRLRMNVSRGDGMPVWVPGGPPHVR